MEIAMMNERIQARRIFMRTSFMKTQCEVPRPIGGELHIAVSIIHIFL